MRLVHLITVCVITGWSAARAQVPLPSNIAIEAPGPDVAAAYAGLSGAWGNGAWDGVLPSALVVERIHADQTADVIYATGNAASLRSPAQWLRFSARIDGQWLTVSFSNGATARFRPGAPDQLLGDYTTAGGLRSNIVLGRLRGSTDQIVAAAAAPVQPSWKDIEFSERSAVGSAAGSEIRLQASLYRTSVPGRRPVVIFNHGSTDNERPNVRVTYRYEAQARWFLAHGCNVVVPMRKGRGFSAGPMLEPSNASVASEVQVASGLEDLDTVVDALGTEPWVDPARIIVAGQSRGGFLSVIYAARHPAKVAGVINFSGGWWSEASAWSTFSSTELIAAGKTSRRPELWLYADHDHYYTLRHTGRIFGDFVANGGTGEFFAFDGVRGDGHGLVGYIDLWEGAVAEYLRRVDSSAEPPRR